MGKSQESEPVSHLPLSIRMNRPGFDLMLLHRENVGLLKGAVFGVLFAANVFLLRGSPPAMAGLSFLSLVSLYQIYRVARRAEYFNSFKKDVVAVADEYEMYLLHSNLGTIVKTVQAEVSGEAFRRGGKLTDDEIGAIVEATMRNSKERPAALSRLNEAARLIGEAVERWSGRYPSASLERVIGILEAIRTAEERRTMRIVVENPKGKEDHDQSKS